MHVIKSSRLSPRFCTVCDKKLSRSLGTRLASAGAMVSAGVMINIFIANEYLICTVKLIHICEYDAAQNPQVKQTMLGLR